MDSFSVIYGGTFDPTAACRNELRTAAAATDITLNELSCTRQKS